MFTAEKIRVLLLRKNMTIKQLAEKINDTPSNLGNKLKRNNFPENELREIANALGCTVNITFTNNDTGEQL